MAFDRLFTGLLSLSLFAHSVDYLTVRDAARALVDYSLRSRGASYSHCVTLRWGELFVWERLGLYVCPAVRLLYVTRAQRMNKHVWQKLEPVRYFLFIQTRGATS